jgi:hypothetical protein
MERRPIFHILEQLDADDVQSQQRMHQKSTLLPNRSMQA